MASMPIALSCEKKSYIYICVFIVLVVHCRVPTAQMDWQEWMLLLFQWELTKM